MEIVNGITSLVTHHPSLAEPLLQFLGVVDSLAAEVSGGSGGGGPDVCDIERRVEAAADQLVCRGLGRILSAFQPDSDLVEADGVQYRRMKTATLGEYFARRGSVEIERHLYRQVGVHNGPTIVPLELRAGLVGGRWTPLAAAAAAHLLQDEPSRDAVNTCGALGVMPYSRSSLSRVGEQIGESWEENRADGEDHLASHLVIPEEATAVSLSVDRVSLPMVELLLDAEGQVVLDAQGKPRTEVNCRMAFCGIWTLYDADGEPLLATRYGRMPYEGHDPIEESLRGDLDAILLVRPDLDLVGLADGAPEMQQLLARIFLAVGRPDAPIGVDFWHLLEKVADATRAAGHEPADFLPAFKETLRQELVGIERIELYLRTWALAYDVNEVPEALEAALTYIENNRDRMRYQPLVEAGLPIGSGGVEATCKTLVSTRMKRCGASWKTPGGRAVLNLRALAKSSRWDEAMAFLLPTYVTLVRDVRAA